jgi:DNA-binding transcriptional MerR regulator
MLKIGEFSSLSQTSVKTLRFYDAIGLLRPAHVDGDSRYRY